MNSYIQTSYFAIKADDECAISISQGEPNFYHGLSYKPLAPPWNIIMDYKKDGNWQKYVQRYYEEVLDQLHPEEVFDNIMILGGHHAVLLCWEKYPEHCHRSLVANWLNVALDLQIREF